MSNGPTGGRGTPAPLLEREMAGTRPSPCTSRQMTFAEGLAMGVAPKVALEKYEASRLKDITFDALAACVEGGLTREDIAKGFGCTVSSVKWKASQVNYKFPGGKALVLLVPPENTNVENVHGGGISVQPETPPAALDDAGENRPRIILPEMPPISAEELAELFEVEQSLSDQPAITGFTVPNVDPVYVALCSLRARETGLASAIEVATTQLRTMESEIITVGKAILALEALTKLEAV